MLDHGVGANPDNRVARFFELLLARASEATAACVRCITLPSSTTPQAQRFAFGEIRVGSRERLEKGPSFEYAGVRAFSTVLGIQELCASLDAARAARPWVVDGHEVVEHQLNQRWFPSVHMSWSEWSQLPCIVAQSTPVTGLFAPRPLVPTGDGPYCNTLVELVRHMTTFPIFHNERDSRNSRLSIVLDDERARFIGFRVEEDGHALVIRTTGDQLAAVQVVGRLLGTGDEVQFSGPATEFQRLELTHDADHVSAALVGHDSEVLDCHEFTLAFSGTGPEREASATLIRDLLLNGENAVAEFKPWLRKSDAGKFDEVLHTVVAMANCSGGHIIIGVDDHGRPRLEQAVLGKYRQRQQDDPLNDEADATQPQAVEETADPAWMAAAQNYLEDLRDTIQKNINRSPFIGVEVINLGPAIVGLLEISPGDERPYQDDRTNVTYVRRNATNRPPTAEETHELVRRRVGA